MGGKRENPTGIDPDANLIQNESTIPIHEEGDIIEDTDENGDSLYFIFFEGKMEPLTEGQIFVDVHVLDEAGNPMYFTIENGKKIPLVESTQNIAQKQIIRAILKE